ncbi:hypothetical protein, partial [Streptomyces acidiscabies]
REEQAVPSARAAASTLLAAHPVTCDALAGLLGCDDPWRAEEVRGSALLGRHPDTARELEMLLSR